MNNQLRKRSQFDVSGVYQTYCQSKNYEAIKLNSQSNLCVIYFSSNGLYYPDTAAVFHRVIAVKDRYEWKKNIVQSARKVIFVRDVQKQWYVEGINSQVNSIEKLCALLKAESQGMDVVCVGNSAGGYAAVLVGCKLNAARIFSFSGQFSLLHQLEGEFARNKNPTLIKYENVDGYKQNYLLIDLIKASKVPILYFYPAKCVKDRLQAELVRDIPMFMLLPLIVKTMPTPAGALTLSIYSQWIYQTCWSYTMPMQEKSSIPIFFPIEYQDI